MTSCEPLAALRSRMKWAYQFGLFSGYRQSRLVCDSMGWPSCLDSQAAGILRSSFGMPDDISLSK